MIEIAHVMLQATSLYSGKGNYKYHGSEMFQIIIQSFY